MVAPFAFVQFADFWLGDQLNTLVFALNDFEYTFCFYTFDNIDWRSSVSGENRLKATHCEITCEHYICMF